MKNFFIIGIVILLCGLITTSCLKDEGNYDYLDLGNFYVDTVDKQVNFSIKQFSILEVNSNLIYDGNKSDLKFNWSLYEGSSYLLAPSKYPLEESSGITREDFKSFSIAETENLSSQITAKPGNYILEFTATNSTTGYSALMTYQVTVESALGTGLVVIYKGTGTVDLDIVSSPVLNSGVTEASYIRNTYTQANPSKPLTGIPQLCHIYKRSSYNYIYVSTDEDAKRLSSLDMSIDADFEGMFYTPPSVSVKEVSFIDHNPWGAQYAISNGMYYKTTTSGSQDYIGHVIMNDNYVAAPFVMWPYGQNGVVYDQENMRFLFAASQGGTLIPITNSGTYFSFSNTGKKMIYSAHGYDPDGVLYNVNYGYYSIFKNPVDDGSRYLYAYRLTTSSSSQYTTTAALDLTSCTEIANAEFWAFGERGPVVFYATNEKIYQINYNLSAATVSGATDVWTPGAGEEITCMKLFKYDGISLDNSAKDKYLLVATYDSTSGTGKLYLLKSDIVSGALSAEPAAVYEFSGRIGDVDFIAS